MPADVEEQSKAPMSSALSPVTATEQAFIHSDVGPTLPEAAVPRLQPLVGPHNSQTIGTWISAFFAKHPPLEY